MLGTSGMQSKPYFRTHLLWYWRMVPQMHHLIYMLILKPSICWYKSVTYTCNDLTLRPN